MQTEVGFNIGDDYMVVRGREEHPGTEAGRIKLLDAKDVHTGRYFSEIDIQLSAAVYIAEVCADDEC